MRRTRVGVLAATLVLVGGVVSAGCSGSVKARAGPAPGLGSSSSPLPSAASSTAAPGNPAPTSRPAPSTSDPTGSPAIRWVALGDSYSAGTGEARSGGCATSDASYASQLAASLGSDASMTSAACSGATTADVLDRQLAQVTGHTTMVTITVGGDDVGFASIAEQCVLGACPAWLLDGQPPPAQPGQPAGIAPDPGDVTGSAWAVLSHRLVEVYTRIRTAMDARGDLYVLSYPLAFANPDTWPPLAQLAGCSFFSPAEAVAANRFAITLGDTIRAAVDLANRALTTGTHPRAGNIHFVDWRNELDVAVKALDGRTVPVSPTGLCPAPGQSAWLNSVTAQPINVNALHPTACGYWAAAARLAAALSVAPPPSRCAAPPTTGTST